MHPARRQLRAPSKLGAIQAASGRGVVGLWNDSNQPRVYRNWTTTGGLVVRAMSAGIPANGGYTGEAPGRAVRSSGRTGWRSHSANVAPPGSDDFG
jgi:hypothetical protein